MVFYYGENGSKACSPHQKLTASKKLLRIMKLTSLILLTACLGAAARGNTQQVTVQANNAPLTDVFHQIEKQTGYLFFYTGSDIKKAKKVTIKATNTQVEQVLEMVFKNQPLSFEIIDKTVVVKSKNTPADSEEKNAFLPPIDVRGRIVNEAGEPVAGASVMVKGTNQGTNTNGDGYFELRNVDENATLVISAVNIESYEVRVNGRSDLANIGVRMRVTTQQEVIVKTNYWEVKKRENPGNISKVDAITIQKQPIQNSLAAIIARVPGLEITQQTGVPGGNFQIRIRGINSIASGNDPLFVIDGVPFIGASMAMNESSQQLFFNGTSPINGINPSDIESIEVLKDADATAIYGSRGANGVILITTRKGNVGKTKVNLNYYMGVGRPTSKLKLLNTEQYLEMRNEAFRNDNITPTANNAPDLLAWENNSYTDWQKELIGNTAKTTDLHVSISGGDASTQFLIGGGYRNEGTVFPGSNTDQRLSTHFALNNISQNQKFRTSVTFNYSVNNTDIIKRDLTTLALTLPPNAPPLYKESGDLNWGLDLNSNTWVYPYLNHPLSYLNTEYDATTKNLLFNSTIAYSINPSLILRANMGFSDVTLTTITTTPLSSLSPQAAAFEQNETTFSEAGFKNWTIEPQLNWKPVIGLSKFDLLIGATFLEQIQDGTAQIAHGFTSEALMKNISAASSRLLTTNFYSQYRYSAGFARLNYILKEKYVTNFTYRRDGSSRFGSGKQFADFGAIGMAWIFSKENFTKQLPFLSFGKIRVSYGVTGNDQLGNYQYLDSYTSSGAYPDQGGIVGLTPVRLGNPDFAWETNKKFETGIELGLLNDKLQTIVSYYHNRSSDQLVGQPLPPSTGFTSIQYNLPAVIQNSGIEIELTSRNIENEKITWTSNFNLSIPRNNLLKFPELELSPTYANTLVVGQPISIVKQYNYLTVNPQTGLYQFEDVNNNGGINTDDRTSLRFIGQKLYGGLQNSFQYKAFQLDVFFQFVRQWKHNYLSVFGSMPGSGLSNQPTLVMDRWLKEGEDAQLQKFSISFPGLSAYNLYRSSTAAIENASFVRLKNVSISYTFSQEKLKHKMKLLRLFLQGQNLMTISDYKGLDPETGSNFLPPLRIFAAGLLVTL